MAQTSTIVTVLGADRTGIIAEVAATLANNNANIVDIRQSVLGDIFSMTMKVVLMDDNFNDVHQALAESAEKLGVQIQIQREEVFTSMYNI